MPLTRLKLAALCAVAVSLLISGGRRLDAADADEALIVKCTRPCGAVRATVVTVGGFVTQVYDNVDAVAVRVPKAAVASVANVAGLGAIRKDVEVMSPKPREFVDVTAQLASQEPLENIAAAVDPTRPENYNFNLALNNVAALHAAGEIGQNIVVAVIDTGAANVSTLPALSGSVIGGETFVPASQDALSATHRENGSHGTLTAEMAVAHATFLFLNTSPLVRALNAYAPGSAVPCTTIPGNCGLPPPIAAIASAVGMTGTAPGAKIYAMKVFRASGGNAPESRVLAAMDRAITLRRNYNASGVNTVASGTGTESDPFVYSSLKIDVVNMSLGGVTLHAGRDIEDQLTLQMLEAGITLATSAGNDGFAAMTVGSPGTGFGSLTVGAASTAVHERVLRELQFGTGGGALFRPTVHAQTAWFSSRGPTADGRSDPDLVANGDFSFVHGYLALTADGGLVDCRDASAVPGTCTPRLVFASGTSFSSPTVAGAAALLRRAHPTRNAVQIRNALQESANPTRLGDDSTRIDQGNGVLDVAAANALLAAGAVSSSVPDLGRANVENGDDGLGSGGGSVLRNVERAGFHIARFRADRYTTWVRDLDPGEVAQIFIPSDFLTSKFNITVDRVSPALPPDQQNQFFVCGPQGMEFLCGDDVFVQIVDAPTSIAVARAGGFPNSRQPFSAAITNPQTGLVRLALHSSWTNGGRVSAMVTVTRERRFDGLPTSVAIIEQDEMDVVEVDVPAGAKTVVFELAWLQNWARYPTNDLDLVLLDPAGTVIQSGATLNSPERVQIQTPAPGRWTAVIVGFTIHDNGLFDNHLDESPPSDVYTLRADADGKRLKQVQ